MVIDDSFGHWFAGFTDGEGCFQIPHNRNHYCCTFIIHLRVDDKPVLEDIRQRLLRKQLMDTRGCRS